MGWSEERGRKGEREGGKERVMVRLKGGRDGGGRKRRVRKWRKCGAE